jgi:hypothetical protein
LDRPLEKLVHLGTARGKILTHIAAVPLTTTRIRYTEPEPQIRIDLSLKIYSGLHDVCPKQTGLASRFSHELPTMRELHWQDQERGPGALSGDVISAFYDGQTRLMR